MMPALPLAASLVLALPARSACSLAPTLPLGMGAAAAAELRRRQ